MVPRHSPTKHQLCANTHYMGGPRTRFPTGTPLRDAVRRAAGSRTGRARPPGGVSTFRHKPPPGGGRRVVEGFAIRIRTETPGSVDERDTDGNPVPSEVDYALRCSEPYNQGSAPAPRPCLTARRTGALAPARGAEAAVRGRGLPLLVVASLRAWQERVGRLPTRPLSTAERQSRRWFSRVPGVLAWRNACVGRRSRTCDGRGVAGTAPPGPARPRRAGQSSNTVGPS